MRFIKFKNCIPNFQHVCEPELTSEEVTSPLAMNVTSVDIFLESGVGNAGLAANSQNNLDVAKVAYASQNDSHVQDNDVNFPKQVKHKKQNNAHSTHKYSETSVPDWKDIEGRRIVDLNYVCKCLLQAQAHHALTCRGLLCMQQENYKALFSTLWFKCNECNDMFKVTSEKPSPKYMLKKAMVWGTLCSGGTYTHSKELLAFCDVPFMSQKTFATEEMAMDTVLEAAKDESLAKAVEEEKKACLAEIREAGGSVEINEPVKTKVSLDGSWAARSYGSRYTSASGCGAIVAENTRKILYIGCRNKRCSICNRENQGDNVGAASNHKCYRNYSGASGGMEPEIIIEGFQALLAENLWLTTITTDGDSTTVAKVKNAIKYGPSIEHQLCCNHVVKNCGKKLREVIF